ncbi:MAG: four helix bundle protein [Kiritimatiellae bacterium]|nr:four helix bundle protein [Kiritimatiellia bacterium]MDD5521712.1 four helix bundle protein [Kiritimatiellia bacterium]
MKEKILEIKSFEDLKAWQTCRDFRLFAVKLARTLPSEEKYRICNQLIRSARSTTANIAEGYGRYHYQENVQFCRQARGSLYESLDHAITAHDEKLITDSDLEKFRKLFGTAVAVLNGYINYLDRSARQTRKGSRNTPTDH